MSTFELHGPGQIEDVRYSVAEIEAAKAKVQESWIRGKDYRIQTGEALEALRKLLSKKGHGTFRDTVTAMGIPKSTAQDYIRFYNESQGRVAPKPKRTARTSGIRSFKDLHSLKDAVGEYLRQRPEDRAAFWAWLSTNYPKP